MDNNKPTIGVGTLVVGLGVAAGYAVYSIIKKKAIMEREKKIIDIQPAAPAESTDEE